MEAGDLVVASLLALTVVGMGAAVAWGARRVRQTSARVGAELGWPVAVRGLRVFVEGRDEGALVRCELWFEGTATFLSVRIDATGSAPPEVDLARLAGVFPRLRSFSVGNGKVDTTLEYPVADGSLRGRIADLVYLARASTVLDSNALMAANPNTPAFIRHVAEGMPFEEAIARTLGNREDL